MNVTALHPATRANGAPSTYLRRGRTLWLLDIENLAGGEFEYDEMYLTLCEQFRPLIQPGDHVIVAASNYVAARAFFHLPQGWSLKVAGGGSNAADRALIDAVDIAHAATRYEWLGIASDDSGLRHLEIEAIDAGMKVWAVAGLSIGRAVRSLAHIRSTLAIGRSTTSRATAVAA